MSSIKIGLSKLLLGVLLSSQLTGSNTSLYTELLNKAKTYEQNIVYSTSGKYKLQSNNNIYYGEAEDDTKQYDQSPLGSLSTIQGNKEVEAYYSTLSRVDIDYYYNEDEETLIQYAHIVGNNVNSYMIATYREEGLCDVVELQ